VADWPADGWPGRSPTLADWAPWGWRCPVNCEWRSITFAPKPQGAVAVNLLIPFARRGHVAVCVDERVDVVVVAFVGDRSVVEHLREAGIFVFVMVGTDAQARQAIGWGADGLIAQGREAGGHLVGSMPALGFLPHARAAAGQRPGALTLT